MENKSSQTTDPGAPSTIGAIPYFPGLKQYLPNVTCAVIVTYLEMRFPAPQDHSGFPVTVSPETICRDLRLTRRTLGLSLHAVARVYKEESNRWRCARAYR